MAADHPEPRSAGFSAALNGFFRRSDIELFNRGLGNESTLKTETNSGGATIQATHEGAILSKKNLLTLGFEYARNNFDADNAGIFSRPSLSAISDQPKKMSSASFLPIVFTCSIL